MNTDQRDWTHVDEFVEQGTGDASVHYARLMLGTMRMPGHGLALHALTRHFRLFCTHAGKRYRVVMASRMGDIGLSEHFEQATGYQIRAGVDDCSEWGATPSPDGSAQESATP